jgi:nucleoside triphosphate pyrophosphatase
MCKVLASTSPRRAELMRAAGMDFEVRPPGVAEWAYPGGDPADYAEALARAKAESVDGETVIGADTVVVLDDNVLGKPADQPAAIGMLHRLSGRTHEVVTAVAVKDRLGLRSARSTARVTFRTLTPPEIESYVATGEPLDKAGGYGLQGRAGAFVTRIEGDRETVIGLPLRLLERLLLEG